MLIADLARTGSRGGRRRAAGRRLLRRRRLLAAARAGRPRPRRRPGGRAARRLPQPGRRRAGRRPRGRPRSSASRVVEVETHEGDRPEYQANGPDRCFFCKDELFSRIDDEVVAAHRLDAVAYGENADDARRPDRPGAAGRHQPRVLRPLADARADQGRRPRGWPATWACRAPTSRPRPAWPRGSRTTSRSTPEKLRQIDQAESALRAPGLHRPAGPPPRRRRPRRAAGRGPAARRRRPAAQRGRRPRSARPASASSPLDLGRHPVRRLHPAAGARPLTMAEPPPPPPRCWPSFATLDPDRQARRGYPEAVYCAGKTPEQVGLIAADARAPARGVTLFTRAGAEHAAAVLRRAARRRATTPTPGCWPGRREPPAPDRRAGRRRGRRHLRPARRPRGAADRALPGPAQPSWSSTSASPACTGSSASLDLLRRARVVVVAAGMDGALPSVVAGPGQRAGRRPAHLRRLRRRLRGPGRAADHAQRLRARGRRGQHRQRLRRRAPGRPDRRARRRAGADGAPRERRHAWIDASAGVAGDMLLGALVDAGADLAPVQAAVDAVVPGAVRLVDARRRCGPASRGTKVDVEVLTDDPPHRHLERRSGRWSPAPSCRTRYAGRALAVFGRLADAEARVHGTAAEDVHFHEVGALDSIADVVGVCAALERPRRRHPQRRPGGRRLGPDPHRARRHRRAGARGGPAVHRQAGAGRRPGRAGHPDRDGAASSR